MTARYVTAACPKCKHEHGFKILIATGSRGRWTVYGYGRDVTGAVLRDLPRRCRAEGCGELFRLEIRRTGPAWEWQFSVTVTAVPPEQQRAYGVETGVTENPAPSTASFPPVQPTTEEPHHENSTDLRPPDRCSPR